MIRIAKEPVLEEEEWDPQGLNALDKDELESFSSDEDEEEEEPEEDQEDDWDEEEDESEDLSVDGLTELEQMERSLRAEESFDFAMLVEEE